MGSETLSVRVTEAVAREAGESPVDLFPPLFESIDPDALDALFAHPSSGVRVTFDFNGYEVRVTGDGSVSVVPMDTVEA